MNITDITIILPSYNTIDYLILAYNSLREYYPTNEIIILDDGSDDGSWEWLTMTAKSDQNLRLWHNTLGKIVGHTCTYNYGAQMSRNPIISIFHSDMVCYRNYLENMVKHWKPKTVVSATRIEPEGIYPPGKEKILKPFGLNFCEFKKKEFSSFCEQEMLNSKDKITRGIFAPWLISKEDYLEIGGMDERSFAPYPEEDQDFFVRLSLGGFDIIQSRDSLCWHWISRGHRSWAKNGIGHDGSDFKFYQNRARKNYIRKWNRHMGHDEYRCPITHPVYDLVFHITNVKTPQFLSQVEPWCRMVYVDNDSVVDEYLKVEQPTTNVNLQNRFSNIADEKSSHHDIIVKFSEDDFLKSHQENMMVIQNLNQIITDSVESGGCWMECGIFRVKCEKKIDISHSLIKVNNPKLEL